MPKSQSKESLLRKCEEVLKSQKKFAIVAFGVSGGDARKLEVEGEDN